MAAFRIGALAVIMLLSIDEHLQVPEAVTASVGVVFPSPALGWSVFCNRRQARAGA